MSDSSPTPVPNSDPFQGAITLENDVTLAEIWLSLHTNAQAWQDVQNTPTQSADQGLIDGSDLGLLRALQAYPAQDWLALCRGLGVTVYGAVAASWCEGGTLEQVFEGWEASGFPMRAEPAFTRPARLIAPTLLPETTSLRALAKLTNNKTLPLFILLAAKSGPLDIDLSEGVIASADPNLQKLIGALSGA